MLFLSCKLINWGLLDLVSITSTYGMDMRKLNSSLALFSFALLQRRLRAHNDERHNEYKKETMPQKIYQQRTKHIAVTERLIE
jgi:hypothetical protein